MTLYELTGQMRALYAMADDPDVDEQAWLDTMEGIEGELEDKADAYAKLMRQMQADAAALKAEEERLYNRRKALEHHTANMKTRLQEMMQITGKTKFKTQLFSFGIQKTVPRVVIDNAAKVPRSFLIPQPSKLDSAALKDWLKDNTCDFAHLEQGESLRIR